MFTEDDLLPISALQHLLFCERQCALIHVEGLWSENRLTVEGRQLHERAHDGPRETRRDLRTARGIGLRSLTLGLSGQADVVEFHADGIVVPVEYKRGRPKKGRWDEVQLAAQAMCLEEMLGVTITTGALYYGQIRRRVDVAIDDRLRKLVRDTTARLHVLIRSGITPIAPREPKCDRCSLVHLCMPDAASKGRGAAAYLRRSLALSITRPPLEEMEGGRP